MEPIALDWTAFMEFFTTPALMVAAVVALVGRVRAALPWVDGRPLVALATVVVGAALGLVGGALDAVTVAPFAEMARWPGGLLYGVAAGLTAFLGVNVFDLLAGRWGKSSGA